jgi:hypothetical protein
MCTFHNLFVMPGHDGDERETGRPNSTPPHAEEGRRPVSKHAPFEPAASATSSG